MTTTTRTHHRCAVDECTNPTRGDLVGHLSRRMSGCRCPRIFVSS